MKISKLKDFLNRIKVVINISAKKIEDMETDLIIDRAVCDEEDLLLDIKQELIEHEQKNIKELREICNKYENKLEEIENETK